MVAVDIALTTLTKSLDALREQFNKSVEFADNAQRQALGLGLTYEEANKRLTPAIDGLRGSLDTRFQAGLRALEAGLQGNTKGISTLINQQQLTDTTLSKTASVFAKTNSILQISNDANNELAISLIETGNKYGISTAKLVNAIDDLASTFPAAALAGMGENVLAAVTQLQAELGPQLAGPLNQVMRMVMDTSMQGYERLTTLGIGQVREQLAAAKSASEAQQILKDAFVTASNTFKSVAGDASRGFYQIGIASEIFGEQAINLTTVADNLGKRIAEEGDQAADFGQTMKNLKEEVLVPFQRAFVRLYPVVVETFDVIAAVSNKVFEGLFSLADELTLSDDAFKKVKTSLVDAGIGFITVIENVSLKFLELIKFGGPLDRFALQISSIAVDLTAFLNTISLGRIGDKDAIAQASAELKAKKRDRELGFPGATLLQNSLLLMEDRGIRSFDVMQMGREKFEKGDVISKAIVRTEEVADKIRTALDSVKENIENDENLRPLRDRNIENTAIAVESLDRKTPDLPTVSSYLDETVNTIGRSLERILGIEGDNTSAEILDELRMQTPLLLQQNPKAGLAESDSL